MNSASYTGSAAMAVTFSTPQEVRLHEVRLHLDNDSPKVEDFTITLDSSLGSAYNVVIMRHPMQDVDDSVCDFDDMWFLPDDKIIFSWANSDIKTWGLEIKFIPAC